MPIREQDNSVFDNFELRLNDRSKKFLTETSKWTFILAIIGFIGIGLMLFFAVFFLIAFSVINTSNNAYTAIGLHPYVFAIIYLISAIVSFFPVLYLYRFSRKMKAAIADKNTEDLTAAFSNLKSHYKFIGITTIIFILFYIVSILFAIISGVAAASGI